MQMSSFGRQVLNFTKNKLITETRRTLEKAERVLRDVFSPSRSHPNWDFAVGGQLALRQEPEKRVEVKILDLGSVDFDEMVQFWPLKEFWLDELGSFYYGLKSKAKGEF